jgi:hypothetical protein
MDMREIAVNMGRKEKCSSGRERPKWQTELAFSLGDNAYLICQ